MKSKQVLIIFYRNPKLGKVKTRLATTLGDEKALAVYLKLSAQTRLITEQLSIDKVVYYTDFIDKEDNWGNDVYKKELQQGDDLGERMMKAFFHEFKKGYTSVCIIGTDCYDLTNEIIEDAFGKLTRQDVVIGPAYDGGYYLLGMNKLYPDLFNNKTWGSNTVYKDTLSDFINLNLNYGTLKTLHDVDDANDLPTNLIIKK